MKYTRKSKGGRYRYLSKSKVKATIPISVRPKTKAIIQSIAKTTAKKLISRSQENKQSYLNGTSIPVRPQVWQPYIRTIIPSVAQGTTTAGRIGNSIKCKGLYVNGMVKIDFKTAVGSGYPTTATSPNIYVRLMCLESKTYDQSGIQSTSILTQNGNNVSPQNIVQDLYAPIDTDNFIVHYNKVFKIQNPLNWANNTTGFINPNYTCFRRFKFSLLKDKTITYDRNSDSTTLNHQPQLLAFLVDPEQPSLALDSEPVIVDWSSCMYYEDP